MNPICGNNGLFPSITQTNVEFYENTNSKGSKSVWARFYYEISMHHSSGETFGPITSMVAVPMNGAQSSGSAQSYALKQFFRGTLMIPTGDKDDADLSPTERHSSAGDQRQQSQEPQVSPSQRICDQMIAGIREHGAPAVESDPKFPPALAQLRKDAPELAAHVDTEIETWKKASGQDPSSLVGEDEIPY